MTNLHRRLRKLEAQLTDRCGLVPYSQKMVASLGTADLQRKRPSKRHAPQRDLPDHLRHCSRRRDELWQAFNEAWPSAGRVPEQKRHYGQVAEIILIAVNFI